MKRTHIALLFFLFAAGFSSCEKEKVEDPIQSNSPVFKAEGTLGTESFSVAAGDDNFFMSTFSEMVQGVDLYSGKLSDGNFEIEVGLFNGNIDRPQAQMADHLPSELNYSALAPQPLFQLSKQMFPNSNNIDQIRWYVNGTFVGINSFVIDQPGKYEICAEVSFNSGKEGIVCNELIIGYEKHAHSILRHFVSPGGDLQVWLDEQDVPVSSIKWYMDGEYVHSNDKLIGEIDNEMHVVRAEVTYANGVVRSKSVLLDGSACGSFLDDFSVFENNPSILFRDYTINLIVRKNGIEYTSINAPNDAAEFVVTELDYYGQNAAGKAVIKISAEIECTLKNNSTGAMIPFSGTITFGVEVN